MRFYGSRVLVFALIASDICIQISRALKSSPKYCRFSKDSHLWTATCKQFNYSDILELASAACFEHVTTRNIPQWFRKRKATSEKKELSYIISLILFQLYKLLLVTTAAAWRSALYIVQKCKISFSWNFFFFSLIVFALHQFGVLWTSTSCERARSQTVFGCVCAQKSCERFGSRKSATCRLRHVFCAKFLKSKV